MGWACVLSCFSRVWIFVTPWTVACQGHLSMGFSRQEYWSGLPCPPPGDLPHPGIKPVSLTSPTLAGRFFTTWDSWEAQDEVYRLISATLSYMFGYWLKLPLLLLTWAALHSGCWRQAFVLTCPSFSSLLLTECDKIWRQLIVKEL